MNVAAFPPVRSMETSGSGCGLTCWEEINLHKDTVGAAWPVLLLQLSSRADVPHQGSARPGPTPRSVTGSALSPGCAVPAVGELRAGAAAAVGAVLADRWPRGPAALPRRCLPPRLLGLCGVFWGVRDSPCLAAVAPLVVTVVISPSQIALGFARCSTCPVPVRRCWFHARLDAFSLRFLHHEAPCEIGRGLRCDRPLPKVQQMDEDL